MDPNRQPSDQEFGNSESDIFSAIEELSKSTEQMIRMRRKKDRMRIDADAHIVPGNMTDRDTGSWSGVCHDISPSGCRVILERPVVVGNIYFLTLDTNSLNFDPVFVRCIRCQLLREDKFECGFSFFSEVKLSENADNEIGL